MCHLYVHISTRRYLYTKFSINDHLSETIVDIRDDKLFVHIRMLLYPAISIGPYFSNYHCMTLFPIIHEYLVLVFLIQFQLRSGQVEGKLHGY